MLHSGVFICTASTDRSGLAWVVLLLCLPSHATLLTPSLQVLLVHRIGCGLLHIFPFVSPPGVHVDAEPLAVSVRSRLGDQLKCAYQLYDSLLREFMTSCCSIPGV